MTLWRVHRSRLSPPSLAGGTACRSLRSQCAVPVGSRDAAIHEKVAAGAKRAIRPHQESANSPHLIRRAAAHRPNPLGLHRVTVRELSGTRLRIGPSEAIDGTPVVDLKPVLDGRTDARRGRGFAVIAEAA